MIANKRQLIEYLEADRIALGKTEKKPPLLGQEVWKFEIALRKVEYYQNVVGG